MQEVVGREYPEDFAKIAEAMTKNAIVNTLPPGSKRFADGYFSRDGSLASGDRSPTMRMATPVTRPTISASAG
jgi:N-dimethylarginine dimethylaminohydrolase